MENLEKTMLFETAPIPKAVAKLAIPTIIGSLVMVLYNMADSYFVGAINKPIESAAVSLAAPVLLAFNAIINLFGVGTASYMSRCLGKKDYESLKKTSAFGFYLALVCALLFSLACSLFNTPLLRLLGTNQENFEATKAYMFWTVSLGAAPSIMNLIIGNMIRAEGESFHGSVGTMSGCILNIILDPVFIMPWGLDMGAAGAGCATFISNCVACLYFAIVLIKKKDKIYMSFNPKYFSFDKTIIKEVATVGVPAAIQNLLNVTGMTVLNNFTSAFGTAAVAAMGIAHKVDMVPLYFSMGLGQGIMPLIGYNYSSGNKKRMRDAVFFTGKICGVIVVLATIIMYIYSPSIISAFMKNEDIIYYGGRFLKNFCIGIPFLALDFLAVGIFQATGKGKESFIFAILRKIALEIPALFILNKIYPLYGLAFAQPIAEFVLAITAVFILKKILSD